MNADRRLAALRRRLASEEIEAIIITDVPNVRYITGFEGVFDDGANVACMLTDQFARVYTDSRYSEAVAVAAEGTPWILHVQRESLYIELCDQVVAEGVQSVALESNVPYGRFRFLSERFGGRVEVVDQWVEELRQVKEAAEVERITRAAELTVAAFEYALGLITPGATEAGLALEIEYFMRSNGADGVAFAPIVASGPNASKPHAVASTREIGTGDLVVLDIGARFDGYCADMTRTVAVGKATERQREIYEAVLEAQETALSQIRGGLRASDADALARKSLEASGLAEEFSHGLGHGVGLEVHEMPSVGPRSRDTILSGSVITVEPGVYVPGFAGVRIEDLVVVDDGGSTLLTTADKRLIEI